MKIMDQERSQTYGDCIQIMDQERSQTHGDCIKIMDQERSQTHGDYMEIMDQERSQTHGDCINIDRSNPLRHHVTIVMRLYPTTGILGNLTPYLGPKMTPRYQFTLLTVQKRS